MRKIDYSYPAVPFVIYDLYDSQRYIRQLEAELKECREQNARAVEYQKSVAARGTEALRRQSREERQENGSASEAGARDGRYLGPEPFQGAIGTPLEGD